MRRAGPSRCAPHLLDGHVVGASVALRREVGAETPRQVDDAPAGGHAVRDGVAARRERHQLVVALRVHEAEPRL